MAGAVIFDMDGLMFDTETLYSKAWEYAGQITGFKITDDLLEPMRGANQKACIQRFKEHFGKGFDYGYVRQFKSEYVESYLKEKGVPCKPGLFELMNYLKNNDFKIALATSTLRTEAERYLLLADVYRYFDVLVFGDMIEKGKPFPDIYLKAAEKLYEPPENCFVLEDSYNGIKAGYSAGCKVIMIPDKLEPDEYIQKMLYKRCNSLGEVIDVCKLYKM